MPILEETTKPFIADSLAKLRQWRAEQSTAWILIDDKDRENLIGFVPTMGALHDGHLELVRQAMAMCGKVVVSIFVNPYQFAPTEDFGKYPRTFESDLAKLAEAGVDCVFYPTEAEIYPNGRDGLTSVVPPSPLNDTLEGAFRPTFFRGVATIVTKLFTLVQPHAAFFGQKDYQQLLVIKSMVRDLDLPVQIVEVETVREVDGLAMSSRNAYLSGASRQLAPALHKALKAVEEAYLSGRTLEAGIADAQVHLKAIPDLEMQYLSVCHADTLVPLDRLQVPFVALIAAKLGAVRLIDNIVVKGLVVHN